MNIDELRELLQMLLGAGIKPMLCTQNVPVSGHAAKCGVLTEVFEQDIEDYVRLPKALVGNVAEMMIPVSGESMIGANRFNNNRQKAKQKGQ